MGYYNDLLGGARSTRPLNWKQRLQIALESAEGLDYLHRGCKPAIIHRDIKTNNILLNENLEAKIADFGMSKDIGSESAISANQKVVGTHGYIDPEYQCYGKATKKSDVYSFGVVLLEVITGQPHILYQPEAVHIAQWVEKKLRTETIESVVDEGIIGNCNLNCVQMVLDLALSCTAVASCQRPTMTDVVTQLNEFLNLENAVERIDNARNRYSRIDEPNSETTYTSANRTFEIEMEHSREINSYR